MNLPKEPPCVCECDDVPLGKCGEAKDYEILHCRPCCRHKDRWEKR